MNSPDDETRDTLRRLFAQITAILELAHKTSIEGQANTVASEHYKACAKSLLGQLQDAQAIAAAADAIFRNALKAT